ncbi:MAG TPA: PepSY-associated TM helix domain-containing protein [Bryobacteraceae bacterium]|nr:PepSY-associated TM helix domain-containing protein [Bryobacteraceae bacterium]
MHLTAGVTCGIVILIMCVTGVALTYEKQINAWLERSDARLVPAAQGSARLPLETLLAKVKEQKSGSPSAITVRSGASAPVELSMGRAGILYVNPYTGNVLDESQPLQPGQPPPTKARAFFRTMEDWHRWLGAAGPTRSTGKSIMDAGNLAFFFIVLSGLYMWFPRKLSWQHWRPSVWFRGGLTGKARDWNWHNVIGVWCWVPLVVVVGSGVIMSYPWASNLLYTMTGSPLPPQPGAGKGGATKAGPGAGPGFGGFGGAAPANWDGLDQAWTKAERQVAGWKSIRVQGSANGNAPFTFNIDRGDGTQPQLRGTLTVNRSTGAVMNWADFSSNSTGQRLRLLARFTHTGETLGVWGQTIAGIATLGGAVMVYTGIALSLRRFFAWRRRRRQQTEPEPENVGAA